jgi:hypothetical protein
MKGSLRVFPTVVLA